MLRGLATLVGVWGLVSFILVCVLYASELNSHVSFKYMNATKAH